MKCGKRNRPNGLLCCDRKVSHKGKCEDRWIMYPKPVTFKPMKAERAKP